METSQPSVSALSGQSPIVTYISSRSLLSLVFVRIEDTPDTPGRAGRPKHGCSEEEVDRPKLGHQSIFGNGTFRLVALESAERLYRSLLPNYPENRSHFVSSIDFGGYRNLRFRLPTDEDGIEFPQPRARAKRLRPVVA
jgi:hypothetical protein